MNLPLTLHVNGTNYDLSLDTRTTLLDTLREHLVGQLPSTMALCCSLVVANRTDTSRNGVGGRRT